MMRYLGLIIIIGLLIAISGIIWVGIIMLSVYLKSKFNSMNEDKWDRYFEGIAVSGIIIRGTVMYIVAILITSIGGYFIFRFFSYNNPFILSILVFIVGIGQTTFKLLKNKEEFLKKLSKFKKIKYINIKNHCLKLF